MKIYDKIKGMKKKGRGLFLGIIILSSQLIIGILIGISISDKRIDEALNDRQEIRERIAEIQKERDWSIVVDYLLKDLMSKINVLEDEVKYWKNLYIQDGGKIIQ